MVTQLHHRENILSIGQMAISKNPREVLKAVRVATSIVVVVYDTTSMVAGMVHMALPDSKVSYSPGDSPHKFVDLALPLFLEELLSKRFDKTTGNAKIIGGAQLFNFGGGGGNLLNIGTRNAITTRTMLSREGVIVEKTETGGNKPRTVTLEVATGVVTVHYPGEGPRTL